jgi:hypothetical protein
MRRRAKIEENCSFSTWIRANGAICTGRIKLDNPRRRSQFANREGKSVIAGSALAAQTL